MNMSGDAWVARWSARWAVSPGTVRAFFRARKRRVGPTLMLRDAPDLPEPMHPRIGLPLSRRMAKSYQLDQDWRVQYGLRRESLGQFVKRYNATMP